MTALVWDTADSRSYETGVERGVFYPSDGGPGVTWEGLISVAENVNGAEQFTYAVDGVTYLNAVGGRSYQATVQAYSAPREFAPYVGEVEVVPGFILTKQPKMPFGFSYRTLIGDSGYKIHVVYNATAAPTSRSYGTTNDTPTPVSLEWKIDATPVQARPGTRPAAHYIINSLEIDATTLASVEDLLYGTDTDDPQLPLITDLVDLIDPPPAPTPDV